MKTTFEYFKKLLSERILVIDGAMGTMIQRHKLTEKDFIDKKNLKLKLRNDSTRYITSCFLTWKDGKKYNLSDVKKKRKKIIKMYCQCQSFGEFQNKSFPQQATRKNLI